MATSASGKVLPPSDFILVNAGVPDADVTLPPGCRGLLVGTGGSLNVTMVNGEQRNAVPFFAGQNPGFFRTVRSGGDAENIWAIV